MSALGARSLSRVVEFLPVLIVAIFGADLHKLAINTGAVFLATPLAWVEWAKRIDMVMALFVLGLGIVGLLQPRIWTRLHTAAFLIQLAMLAIMTVSLYVYYDEMALYQYSRYLGGNFALFLASLSVCTTFPRLRLVWSVWLLTCILHGFIGIWCWREGYLWTSIRETVIPGTGIRMGYQCAVGFVFCLNMQQRSIFQHVAAIACAFGVLMGGSKMSFLLAATFTLVPFCFLLLVTRRMTLNQVIIVTFGLASLVALLIFVTTSEKVGFHKYFLEAEAYRNSTRSRLSLGEEFTALAADTPVFGRGISAAYYERSEDDLQHTHSIMQAMYVQTGLVGLLSYLCYLSILLLTAGYHFLYLTWPRNTFYFLAFITFCTFTMLIIKAEVTSDIPGNREQWMFAGLLVNTLTLLRFQGHLSRRTSRQSESQLGEGYRRRQVPNVNVGSLTWK